MLATRVLAHQGGWDEILMVIAPLALFWLLLRTANRRHAQSPPTDQHTAQHPDPPAGDARAAGRP